MKPARYHAYLLLMLCCDMLVYNNDGLVHDCLLACVFDNNLTISGMGLGLQLHTHGDTQTAGYHGML